MKGQLHYSADIETLGTGDDAVILTIALVPFIIDTGEIAPDEQCLYTAVNLTQELAAGAKLDESTLKWWLTQNADVLAEALSAGTAYNGEIADAINDVIDTERCKGIWGNGSTFDITKIGQFQHRNNALPIWENNHAWPWGFRYVRDMRTIVAMARDCGFNDKAIEFDGDKHNALADAKHQAKVISAAYQFLRKGEYDIDS